MSLSVILVPQGAEYQAVCTGLKSVANPPIVIPTPAGAAISDRLKQLQQKGQFAEQQSVLIVGLCGGLKPDYSVGEVLLYEASVAATGTLACDRPLTRQIQSKLGDIPLVRGWTSDRVVSLAVEKQALAHQAEVVDMEGYPALEFLTQLGMAVATLRVVSDDCRHDLPDLSQAFSASGELKPLPLTVGLLRQPIAGLRLIRGSLTGLKVLQRVMHRLFAE